MENIALKQNYYYKIKLADNSPAFFGMFYNYEPNTGNLMFIYNVHDHQLSIETIIVSPNCTLDYINHEEWSHIMLVLIVNGYYFEETIGINLIYKPLPGEVVFFSNVVTEESGYGAYLMGSDEKISMYAYQSSKGVFYKNLSYQVGDRSNTYLKKATRQDKENFNTLLSVYGKQWSYALKRVLPTASYRARKNNLYCYINDRFTITTKKDEHTATDNNRFNAGNYFRTEDEAQEVLTVFNEILIKRQAQEDITITQSNNIGLPTSSITDEKGNILKRKRGRPRKNK